LVGFPNAAKVRARGDESGAVLIANAARDALDGATQGLEELDGLLFV
jgi:hypothetical protein